MLTKNEIFALSLIPGVGNKSIQNIIDSDFVLVQIDMRHFFGYTVRNIA